MPGGARKDRPPLCPKCGSKDTVWNGKPRTLCKSCGGQTTTIKVRRRSVLDEGRPPCPRCGSRHVWKQVVSYKCTKCGKSFPIEPLEEF